MANKEGSVTTTLVFEETQAGAEHGTVLLRTDGNFPPKFSKPAAYIVSACRRRFDGSLLHSFARDHLVLLICKDPSAADQVRAFATDLLNQMREDVKTFHLRLDGTEALNKTQVTKLASGLGQLQTVEMKGSRSELYGDHAIITTKAPLAWSWPRKLRYRAYSADFEVRLSLVPGQGRAPAARPPHESEQPPSGDEWQSGGRRNHHLEKRPVCRDFARGTCERGEACIFRHALPGLVTKKGKSTDPCRDFRRGRCARDQCKFVHAGDSKIPHKSPADDGDSRAAAAGSPSALGSIRSGTGQISPQPHDGAPALPPSSSSSPSSSSLSPPASALAPSPSSSPSAPTSRPRRRGRGDGSSDGDMEDSPPGSPAAAWTPTPDSPRSDWLKPLALSTPAAPTLVLGQKRSLAQTAAPPAARHAAPLVGAGLKAP